ncbi:alpha beta hydrolase [Fusarium langsethiae]|uniref:Alpha beta hydrolase n=1 Tax=Fusarium langsethiae TaxID=179993 RepID=A0A0M9ERY0_FUSLA|nr:alpha beta hydrolase [Fusarium langsethiae]
MSAERIAAGFEATAPDGVFPRFVGLNAPSKKRSPSGQHTCQGLYWTLHGKTPIIAFVATHYNADFMEHYLAGHLAASGYGFLGWNTRFRGLEDLFILVPALEDIGVGVRWLKEVAGVQKVILIGNSGGGSLMAAYHARSQDDASLVKADAFIFINAHTGRPNVLSNWLDPAVIDEDDPVKTDPTLDMYNPANGPPYSEEFIKRYRAAQIERSNRITGWVKKELQRLNDADATIDPSDRPAPSCYFGDPMQANRGIGLAGRSSSLCTWQSLWSLQDSEIEFDNFAVKWKDAPTIVIQGTSDVGVYNSDARNIFDSLVTNDKELHFIPGGHFFNDSQEVFDGVVKLIVSWVAMRFP